MGGPPRDLREGFAHAVVLIARNRRVDVDLLDRRALRPRHDENARRDKSALEDRMCHEDDGRAELLLQRHQPVIQFAARDFVERGEGLVHQNQRRAGDEGAGDGAAHFHAAGKFARQRLRKIREADARQRIHDRLMRLRPALARKAQRQIDIVEDARPGQQRRFLKDEADISPRGGVRPFDRARARLRETGDQPQDGGFAASRRAEQRKRFTLPHREVETAPAPSRHWERFCRRLLMRPPRRHCEERRPRSIQGP